MVSLVVCRNTRTVGPQSTWRSAYWSFLVTSTLALRRFHPLVRALSPDALAITGVSAVLAEHAEMEYLKRSPAAPSDNRML